MEFCLQKLPAPKNAEILASIAELKNYLTEVDILELTTEGLHGFIDELQIGLGQIHEQTAAAYFTH